MATKLNKKSMAEKIVIQRRDNEMASRIVGTIFIVVGAILVGLGIYSFVTYKTEPKLDKDIEIPVLSEIDSAINKKSITLSGTAEDAGKVRIFVNDELLDTVKVEDKRFSYTWNIEDEGIYTIKVDGLKGFPRQKKSESSDSVMVTVDWTSPSKNISLDYTEESSSSSVVVKGTTEAYTTVYVKRGTESFSTISDSNGDFEITITLEDEGKNVFNILLEDKAGNETTPDEKIRVTYSPNADVDGDGTTDELPQASGNLSEALKEVFTNKLMSIFGILSLLAMTGTSVILFKKHKETV
jgi:hypothetical protein